MFTLTVRTSTAAFHTEGEDREEVFAPEIEVQRILREVAERVEYDTWAGSVFDINGHNVGSFELAQEDTEVSSARERVIAYLAEMDRVQAQRQQYADASHEINQHPLNRSDLRLILGLPEGR